MNFSNELDYASLTTELEKLCASSKALRLSYIGNSILLRKIPIITIGDDFAKKSVLYVSTHHAAENVCTSVLLSFIEEYIYAHERGKNICGINIGALYKMRKIYIVPMLNPDGVEYRLNGIDAASPIKERISEYNHSGDFSDWNANARGVDINHNYNAYFEEYKEIEKTNGITAGKTKYSGESAESEPETAALANFIRCSDSIEGIITLHTQGEEIYYKSKGKSSARNEYIAKAVSKMTGYTLSEADGTASYGGLTDWFIKEYGKPSLTLECGTGKNPLPPQDGAGIYARIRESLFTFPILI